MFEGQARGRGDVLFRRHQLNRDVTRCVAASLRSLRLFVNLLGPHGPCDITFGVDVRVTGFSGSVTPCADVPAHRLTWEIVSQTISRDQEKLPNVGLSGYWCKTESRDEPKTVKG